MIAFFDDGSFPQDDDAVGAADGAQTMGDEDRGRVRENQLHGFLNLHLGEGIDAGGGFIQDEDRRALNEDAQQAHELTLPHAQTRAALAHVGMKAIRALFPTIRRRQCCKQFLDLVLGGSGRA